MLLICIKKNGYEKEYLKYLGLNIDHAQAFN